MSSVSDDSTEFAPSRVSKKQDKIKFRVNINDKNVTLKANPKTPFKQVIDQVCDKLNLKSSSFLFKRNGKVFSLKETPESLGLLEDDVIIAMSEQVGGNK